MDTLFVISFRDSLLFVWYFCCLFVSFFGILFLGDSYMLKPGLLFGFSNGLVHKVAP